MFQKAQPIWLSGLESQVNCQAIFSAQFSGIESSKYRLMVTGATLYRVFLNGDFIHYGPARAPHGFAYVDELDLTDMIISGENSLRIEVSGSNCPSYYTVCQTSFIQAEVLEDGQPVIYTGSHFHGFVDEKRVRKCIRYSFQRTFSEHWKMGEAESPFPCAVTSSTLSLLPREVPYPEYREWHPVRYEIGNFERTSSETPQIKGRSWFTRVFADADATKGFVRFPEREVEVNPVYELLKIQLSPETDGQPGKLHAGEYLFADLGKVNTGFICLDIDAHEDSRIIIAFDERVKDGALSLDHWEYVQALTLDFPKRDEPYHFQSFECDVLRYAWIVVIGGSVTVKKFSMAEYVAPDVLNIHLNSGDETLDAIFEAAKETYRQNAMDVFMDCPSRERAGYLSDSFYAARGAYLFSGSTERERVFLENFIMRDDFPNVPHGMLPSCYPCDNDDCSFMVSVVLWYIIQLDDYAARSGDAHMERFHPSCERLLVYLSGLEDEYGFLEGTANFIEWSEANSYRYDVNFPTNMLYAYMLEVAGRLLSQSDLLLKAETLRKRIIEWSFDGTYFIDNAIRGKDGALIITENHSEVCQYYAFCFGIARREDPRFQTLYNTILTLFGPARRQNGLLPEFVLADAYGYIKRLDLLVQWGYKQQALEEIKQYYGRMAKATGTLWEMDDQYRGSLCHGYQSFVGVLLYKLVNENPDNNS